MDDYSLKNVDISEIDEIEVIKKENLRKKKICNLSKKYYKKKVVLFSNNFYFTSKAFNDKFHYSGDDLGFTYSKSSTSFKVWAPFAEKISLLVYRTGDIASKEKGTEYSMEKDIKGTWKASISGDVNGIFYTYKVKNPGAKEQETGDPYAKAVGINGDRSAVIDLTKTNPQNWDRDEKPVLRNITDAVIYELHIRDLAMNKDSGIKNKGKFTEFTENVPNGDKGITRGINHLKDLGINVLHLLPSFDFATIDEKTLYKNEFNWGYDPKNYNVPEGSYSTDPSKPYVRITEYKEMILALHQSGIRVVMDVVYNHTYDNIGSKFNILVPGYYYRTNLDGTFVNCSECGNDTASERSMMRKYIVDSVKYWAKEYHVDGFRFDLMGLHDIETMNEVRRELSKIDDSIIIYGEGWDMGTLPRCKRAIQHNSSKLYGIGLFNDNIRDNLKGPWNDVSGHGFVDGKQNMELEIMKGIVGSISYNNIIKDYNIEPGQSINYVEAHDNNTLWDKLLEANRAASENDIIKMDTLANSVILTSQGVPFIAGGGEFLRTKNGDENSYRSPDNVNEFIWARKARFINVFNYYKGLIELRKSHLAFKMPTTIMIKKNLTFVASPRNTIAYVLKNNANGDIWKNIFVAYNANNFDANITIPAAEWKVVVKADKSGVETIDTIMGNNLTISPLSTIVMYTNDNIEVMDLFCDL